MDRQGPATDTDLRAVIAAALVRIEAATVRLTFADEASAATARRDIVRGVRAIRHHARPAADAGAPPRGG